MTDVVLKIESPQGVRRLELAAEGHLTIGRCGPADVVIDDSGLSRTHASLHRSGDKIWISDEGSRNGTFVNDKAVGPSGTKLADKDRITIGNGTSILVETAQSKRTVAKKGGFLSGGVPFYQPSASDEGRLTRLAGGSILVVLIGVMAVLGIVMIARRGSPIPVNPTRSGPVTPVSADSGAEAGAQTDRSSFTPASAAAGTTQTESPMPATSVPASGAGSSPPIGARRLYQRMPKDEQADYIDKEARHIAFTVGQRPCTFTPEVLNLIKYWVDSYAGRVGNNQTGLWREDLRTVFKRGSQYAPIILREFRKKNINGVIGIYIPMIETEYNNISYENKAGAMGLFQFTAPTARAFGVSPAERSDVDKMSVAAAEYIADRLSEFGTDAVGVSLSIAGYNRSPDSVRRDLYNTIDPNNRERSFWTLVANKAKLDQWFQTENVMYVPRFFAAAIIGENPWDFGIDLNQLSSYSVDEREAQKH